MPGKIYVIQSDSTLQALSEQPYPQEGHLQDFLAKYPDLLAGDQMNEADPRRWLLVKREFGVPGTEGGPDHWSLDHLFLDQDGIPTLVEVKRSSDTRIRREVVGQMLDYAANAVVYWPVERIRAQFETTSREGGKDPVQVLGAFLGYETVEDFDVEAYWARVKTNLQAAKIRMVFVADEIPPELRRIVEFLNTYMDPVEVLAVEVHQYVGNGLKTLVPRVIGQTAAAQRKKGAAVLPSRQWDEASFFAEFDRRQMIAEAQVARALIDWAKLNMPEFYWGRGKVIGSFAPSLTLAGRWHNLIGVQTDGLLLLFFNLMKDQPPFDQESLRLELLGRLNAISGVKLGQDSVGRLRMLKLTLFRDPETLRQLTDVLDWAVDKIRSS